MTEREIDKILTTALEDAAYIRYRRAVAGQTYVPPPSRKYQREMRRMLSDPLRYAANYSRPVWLRALRTAAAVFAALLVGFGAMMSVPSVRAAVVNCVTTWYEEFVSIRFPGDTSAAVDETAAHWHLDVPEGYTETVEMSSATREMITYTHETEPQIHFESYLATASLDFKIDTEQSTQSIIELNGHNAYRFDAKTTEFPNKLVWYDETQEYVFCLSGKVPIEDLLNAALSLTKNS